jgi:hypothetical protein
MHDYTTGLDIIAEIALPIASMSASWLRASAFLNSIIPSILEKARRLLRSDRSPGVGGRRLDELAASALDEVHGA